MAGPGLSCLIAADNYPSSEPSSTPNLADHFYPEIPPRRSSIQHGLKFSRSGNSLGGGIDVRSVSKSVKSTEGSESEQSLKSPTLPSSVEAEILSLPKRGQQNKNKRRQEIDLSQPCDTASSNSSQEPVSNAERSPSRTSNADELFPFPLSPKPLVLSGALIPVKRRALSVGGALDSSPSTSDRFIPSRNSGDGPTRAFRVNKDPKDLSWIECLNRSDGAGPDPFTARRFTPIRRPGANDTSQPRGSSTSPNAPSPARVTSRATSLGGVWNIGGSASSQQRPVSGVSNGRGGLLGSGTNAPMYSSTFFNVETPHESRERFEGRIAAALDLDRTARVFNFSHSSKKRYPPTPETSPRHSGTTWQHGEWVSNKSEKVLDAPSLRDDFYCTVLAYCSVLRVLAVGLRNRVYLWSEADGVHYPPRADDNARDTYVTSLSFSSQAGGRSILAIGRSNGKVNLWSPHESMDRIQHPLPKGIACVCFKPVPTRRYSNRQCKSLLAEDLLVGDEVGNVFYYSIEWTNPDPQGRDSTAMILLAKINIHKQQICGIAWSEDGEYFATGGNDNACLLFSARDVLEDTGGPAPSNHLMFPITPPSTPPMTALAPRFVPNGTSHYTLNHRSRGSGSSDGDASREHFRVVFEHRMQERNAVIINEGRERHRWPHSAAVKAIAFCPWQRGLIATGGGSNDRAIHFFHTWSGACLATINVQAQVTSLIWSRTRREIAATFGYAQPDHPYRIAVFSWPDCKQIVSIPWSGDMRALYAIAYPGGPNETGKRKRESEGGRWWSRTAEEGCIVVASSDESVKFHEIWSGSGTGMGLKSGGLGWSEILEGLEGIDDDWGEVIR